MCIHTDTHVQASATHVGTQKPPHAVHLQYLVDLYILLTLAQIRPAPLRLCDSMSPRECDLHAGPTLPLPILLL